MKKILTLMIALMLTMPIYAQHNARDMQAKQQTHRVNRGQANAPISGVKDMKDKKHKEMREFKLKYLAQEMELRSDQQKKFFDLYNKMSDERRSVHRDIRKLENQLKNDKNVTERDYAKMTKALTDSKAKEAKIEAKYDAEFAKFLSQKQIFKMKQAEETFRAKMHQMRGKHARK